MKMKQSIYVIIFAIAVLTGCQIGKPYVRPEIEMPEEYRVDDTIFLSDTLGEEPVRWHDIFKDTLLVNLIEEALQRNSDLQNALINIEIAEKYVLQSRMLNRPEIDADILNFNQMYRSENYRSAPNSKWYDDRDKDPPRTMYLQVGEVSSGIFASWEIDFWKKFQYQQEADSADFAATTEVWRAIENRLISNIASAYFNLVRLNAGIEVARRNANLSDSTLRMMELQYEAGEITKLALQQTEAQRLVALSLVPQLEEEIIIQENILRTLANQFPSAVEISTDPEEIVEIDSLIDVGAPIHLLRNRPDVKEAELRLIAANADMNIRQALRYPSLTIGGSTGVNALMPKNWFQIPGSLFGGITAGLTTPVFKRKKLRTEYEVAVLEREKAELDLYRSLYESVAEVSNALVKIHKQKERLEYADLKVDNAQSAVHNANLLFRSGYATYLEVITAQSNALQSDLDRIDIQHQQYEAIIELYSALGAQW